MVIEPEPAASAASYNGDETRRFLKMLGRDEFEFRCFPDSKALKNRAGFGMRRRVGRFDEHEALLISLNRQGYGINVQVGISDGKGYTASHIIGSPALFAD